MGFDAIGGATGAAGGAMAGAKIGSLFGPVGTVAGGIIGGVAGLFSGGKKSSASYKPLDIAKVIEDARASAAANYAGSISLENQFRPGTAALRLTTDAALGRMASGDTPGLRQSAGLLEQIGSPIADSSVSSNPLLEESTNRILNNLRLGGALGPDVQAQAVKAALEKGGAAGISGSGAARGLVARDLGLTSLGLERDRIGQAQEAGARTAQLRLAGEQLGLQDFLGRLAGATAAGGQDIQRAGLLASIIDSRALPESGLSAGSIASLYAADQNAQNQVATTNAAIAQQQRNQNLNALLGLGTIAAGGSFDKLFKNNSVITFEDFVKKNPTSSAAIGQVPQVDTSWKF